MWSRGRHLGCRRENFCGCLPGLSHPDDDGDDDAQSNMYAGSPFGGAGQAAVFALKTLCAVAAVTHDGVQGSARRFTIIPGSQHQACYFH